MSETEFKVSDDLLSVDGLDAGNVPLGIKRDIEIVFAVGYQCIVIIVKHDIEILIEKIQFLQL